MNKKCSMMAKWLILVVFIFFSNTIVKAQQNYLEIIGTGSSVYLEHVVTPKENFYSVGRMYNVNPKELAAYNHLHFATGLAIGQTIKIPLNKNNFTQMKNTHPGQALVPLYHTVLAGETLYRLGVNYNKVPLSNLKKWNNLSSDELSAGQSIIVGFLKVDKNQSALAKGESVPAVASAPVVPPSNNSQPAVTNKEIPPSSNEAQAEPAKTEPATNNNPPLTITPANTEVQDNAASSDYFKNLYEQQTAGNVITDKKGMAGIFKSTSGWQDAKYYCFSNDAAAGKVIRITNGATGKTVYAKVLDVIPDISQNNGLLIVISNSAADKLGAGDSNFNCTVSFTKNP
jgi:LysM repeat protein